MLSSGERKIIIPNNNIYKQFLKYIKYHKRMVFVFTINA